MRYVLLMCFVILTAPVYSQLTPNANTFTLNGRDYDVYTPSDYDSSKTYPVVFELHGFGQDKHDMEDQEVVNELQYIAVYPEGENILFVGRAWNTWSQTNAILGGVDDVAYLTEVYNQVKQNIGTSFDPNQVFVYGYSNGGAMAMKLINDTSLFKGVAVRSMTMVAEQNISATASKVPIVFFHGTDDTTVPYKGGSGTYFLGPKFMPLKEAVDKWVLHNGAIEVPNEVHFLANGGIGDYWYREYYNTNIQAPVFLYVIPNGQHNTNNLSNSPSKTGFSNRNIKRSALKMFRNPACYGLARNSDTCRK